MTTPLDPDHKELLERNVEEDTRIIATEFHRVNGIPFLVEGWSWEGITGYTAVFLPEHVAGWSDDDLQRFLMEQAGLNLSGGVTVTRRPTHLFVNFGFSSD